MIADAYLALEFVVVREVVSIPLALFLPHSVALRIGYKSNVNRPARHQNRLSAKKISRTRMSIAGKFASRYQSNPLLNEQ